MTVNSTHAMVFISPRISATSHCITMVQRRYLTDVDRGRAIAWLQQRIAVREVARRLGVAPSVICRLQQRWQATGRVQDRPRSGRPRKTTRREDRYITRQATMARTSTARHIRGQLRAATQTNVSVSTIKKSPPRSPPPCPSPSKAAKADPCPQKGTPGLVQAPCAVGTCPLVQGDVYR